MVVDIIPTIEINKVPRESDWKSPGVRTVKDDISWLERIQYSPDPIKRRLAPGGIRDSAIIMPQAVFSARRAFTATATAVAFVARALSNRIPMDERNELTRAVSPATGKSICEATPSPAPSLATINENSPRGSIDTPTLLASPFAAESFAPVQHPQYFPRIAVAMTASIARLHVSTAPMCIDVTIETKKRTMKRSFTGPTLSSTNVACFPLIIRPIRKAPT